MRSLRGAGFPTAAPSPGRPLARLAPLAATLGLHLLLVLAWPGGAAHKRIDLAPRPEPVFVLVQPLARPRPMPATRQAVPEPRRRPGKPDIATTVAVPGAATPTPRSTLEAVTEPPTAGEAPISEHAAESATPSTAASSDLFATSKAMARAVDRALRNGASPITAEPDRKWERFADAFAAARTGSANTVTLDSYTAADGVITYRKSAGNRVACYRSGSVGGPVTVFGRPLDNQGAGSVPCPTGVRWVRQ